MKTIVTFLFLVFALIANAQNVEREVISSGGNFYTNSAGQLSTTIGEPVISTYANGSNVLTQGFQQTKIVVTGVKDNRIDFLMNVFPNPTINSLTLKIQELKEGISYTIYSVEGKLLLTNQLIGLETKVDVSNLSKGSYFLNITENNNLIKTYKIIKQ